MNSKQRIDSEPENGDARGHGASPCCSDIKEYVMRRNEAFLLLDKDKIVKMMKEHEIEIPENETVFWASVHIARTKMTDFSKDVKAESQMWLRENGFAV